MYERMLDRTEKPTETAFIHYCGEGGWIHDRVISEQHLDDAKKLLRCKVQKKVITGRKE